MPAAHVGLRRHHLDFVSVQARHPQVTITLPPDGTCPQYGEPKPSIVHEGVPATQWPRESLPEASRRVRAWCQQVDVIDAENCDEVAFH